MAVGECRIECQGTVIDVGLKGAWERVVEHLIRQAPDQDHLQTVSGLEGVTATPSDLSAEEMP